MPSWYRPAHVIGLSAFVLGVLIGTVGYFFVSGDPASVAESEIPDPAWTGVAALGSFALLVLGSLLLLAPFVHQLLSRRRS